jgi:adenylate cyclase
MQTRSAVMTRTGSATLEVAGGFAGLAPGRVERRLAAILMADVAGYSRLVGADEAGTLAQWKAHWSALIDPKIKAHKGRIVRITGDGLLVEFASVVAAVRCAVELQRAMVDRNADVPEAKRIEFRVGINVGDIIIDGSELWGDGVNVAARLEALAEPGGICVSERVYEDVHGRLDVAFEDQGDQQLKNIARPVRVYRVRMDGSAKVGSPPSGKTPLTAIEGGLHQPKSHPAVGIQAGPVGEPAGVRGWPARGAALAAISLGVAALWWATPATKSVGTAAQPAMSIVVLPFANLGGDARQDYFADGITDSLTTDLSRALPGSFVVSRDTAFTYKGKVADVRQIGRELDVRYVLSGSVFPDGERVRVNAKLDDARAGSQLWAERFDVERTDILQVQDEIVGRLARAIGLKVIDVEARRSERERPKSAEAVDLVRRGKAVANRPSSAATMIGARELYEQALKVEPDNIDALAGVATTLVFEVLNGYYETGNEQRLDRAEALLARTLAAEPRHLISLKAKAALLRAQGKFDDGIAAAEAVIAENPAEPWAYKEIGLSAMYLGRSHEALDWFAKAHRFGPRDPGRWTWLDGRGQTLILLGRDQEALRSFRLALEANPNSISTYALLAAACALTGRDDEARAALTRYIGVHPRATVSDFRRFAPVPLRLTSDSYQWQRERLKEGLRKAGMPE